MSAEAFLSTKAIFECILCVCRLSRGSGDVGDDGFNVGATSENLESAYSLNLNSFKLGSSWCSFLFRATFVLPGETIFVTWSYFFEVYFKLEIGCLFICCFLEISFPLSFDF